ncbi:unnamed protein product [Arctogadus glacialis]
MRTWTNWFINGLAQQQLWPETSVDQPNHCFLEPIVVHHNMSSLWEKETQPSLPVSSTQCVSEEQKKAPIDATDSAKGGDHKHSCWHECCADQPNSCCPERSHPETSVDHAKGSSCPEPIVDQPCSLPVSHKPAMF